MNKLLPSFLKREIAAILLCIVTVFVLTACRMNAAYEAVTGEDAQPAFGRSEQKDFSGVTAPESHNANTASGSSATDPAELETEDLFHAGDFAPEDLSGAFELTVASDTLLSVTEPGIYRLSGSASEYTVLVDVPGENDKVYLILDGLNVTNTDFPVIYVRSADRCTVILSENSENKLSVTGAFRADGETNTDAVIFSKDDLSFTGTGFVSIRSTEGNGISCKDDLRITGGVYTIESALDSIEANDSVAVSDGTFTITTGKDGLHCENDGDDTLGFICFTGGSFTVSAKSDAIQGTTYVRFDGGTFVLNGSEGIEATRILINDGQFDIYGSDDGINASKKSTACGTPSVTVNGGYVKVEVGPGDTDAIDANGAIYVNGGTIEIISGMSSFDYDSFAEYTGGTIIINGEPVSEIPQSMMPGGPGGHGGPNGQGGPGGPGWRGGH